MNEGIAAKNVFINCIGTIPFYYSKQMYKGGIEILFKSEIPRHNEIVDELARKICKDLGIPFVK